MLQIPSGYAAVALDIQQQIDSLRGWAVIDGLTVEPSAAGDRSVIVNQGNALCGGERGSLTESLLMIEPPDVDHPRRDVIYVNGAFELRVERGTPNPRRPEPVAGDANPPDRWECWSPWPPSMHTIDGTVLAEVWVAPGSTTFTTDDIRPRQISADKAVNLLRAHQAEVDQVPTDPKDVVRLQDLQESGGELNQLLADLNANGFDITGAGTVTANTMRMTTMDPGLDAVVNRAELQKYYRRSGDTLTGPMNANGRAIQNAGEIDGDVIEAGSEFYLPTHTSDPEGGHMWIRRDIE